MHMQGEPAHMQETPLYDDVVAEVSGFWDASAACNDGGHSREMLLVDPGFGFGKTPEHNIELLANLRQLRELGFAGPWRLSRKSTLGELTGRPVTSGWPASVAQRPCNGGMHGASILCGHMTYARRSTHSR